MAWRSDHPSPPEVADGPPTFPLRAVWLGIGGLLLGNILGAVFQVLTQGLFPGSSAAQILFGVFGLWTGLAGACVLASQWWGTGSLVHDFGWRVRSPDLGYGPLAAIACIVSSGAIAAVFAGSRLAGSNTDIIVRQQGNTVGVAVVTLIAALGAPVFEELFFRGLLRLSFASRLGVGAVWAQAAVFGLAHYRFDLGLRNVSIVCTTAGIGVVLGYTAHLTRRLGAGGIAHGMFNFLVTITIIGVLR